MSDIRKFGVIYADTFSLGVEPEPWEPDPKPHIWMQQEKWCVQHENMTAISDSIKEAWVIYLQMVEKRDTGYYSMLGSSMQFSAI